MASADLNIGIHYKCSLEYKRTSKRKLPATFTSSTYHDFMNDLNYCPKL